MRSDVRSDVRYKGPVAARDVRLYLAGLAVSETGTTAMIVVSGVWVKSLTGSDRAAALTTVCLYLPSLLAPLAGLVADRTSRRRLLVAVNLVGAVWLLPLLLVGSPDRAWLVPAVMVGYGAVLITIGPAETALFTELLPADRRGGVNGLRMTIQEGAKLGAPLAGAGAFALVGGRGVVVADAVTFVVAALVVRAVRVPRAVRDPGLDGTRPGPGPFAELAAGWQHLWRTPALRRLASVGGAALAVGAVPVSAQYALVDALHRPPSFLGVLVSALGAGSIVAGLASGPVLRRTGERTLTALALAAGCAGYLLLATGWLPTVLAGRVVLGFAAPWVVVAVVTAGQRLTPDALQGRVAAAITFALFAPLPLAQAVCAALLGDAGFRLPYLLAAAGAALLVPVAVRPLPPVSHAFS